MTEIKRYDHIWDKSGVVRKFESPNGQRVRWEDVEAILTLASAAVRQCIVQTGRPPDREQNDPPPP